ncbi:hypothetical protein LNQ52_26380 [Klebsiella pneumoniae subsp. pneumoniae]|nr:hypothetical protein [Klebsiella pneumoniae subsp. pneumoniae]
MAGSLPLLQAIFIWMSKVGSFASASCRSCFVSPSRWVWRRENTRLCRRLRRLRWLRGHEPGGQLWLTAEGYVCPPPTPRS